MSFFYPNSTAATRSRRSRDKEGTGRTSSISSHRRSKDLSNLTKESSKTRDERSPPPKASTPASLQNSIYSQQNLALDRLSDGPTQVSGAAAGPASGGASGTVSATTSPVIKAGQYSATKGHVYHVHTPAALQPYLESADETEEEDDDDDEDDEDDEDEEDEEEGDDLTTSLHLSSDNEKDSKQTSKIGNGIIPTSTLKSSTQIKQPEKCISTFEQPKSPVFRVDTDDLTPQPKSTSEKVYPFEDEPRIPGQFPLPSDYSSKSHEHVKSQERPKMSASSISLQDLPRYSRDNTSNPPGSPGFLSRSTSNIEAQQQALPVHERSFTPPAPPLSLAQSRTSPAFISPLPVRPSFTGNPMPHYQPQHLPPSMHQVLEMNQPSPHMNYYAMQHQQIHPSQIPYGGAHHQVPPEQVHWEQQQQQSHQYQQHQLPLSQVPPMLPSPPSTSAALENHRGSQSSTEDETTKMLGRIQSVLPDFHMLLNSYREVSSRVGFQILEQTKNQPIEQAEEHLSREQQQDSEKDSQIEALTAQLEQLKQARILERNQMRMQIGNLEEEKLALVEDNKIKVDAHSDVRRDLQVLRDQFTSLNIKATQDKSTLESRVKVLQDQLDVKIKAEASHNAKLTAKDEASRKDIDLKEATFKRDMEIKEATFKKDLTAKDDSWKKAYDTLSTKYSTEQKQNEDNLSKVRSERENAVRSRDTELEKLRKIMAENTATWNKERDSLKNGWDKECREIKTQWEDHCRRLTNQHTKDRDDLQRSWETSQQKQLKRNDQLEDERNMLRKDTDRIRAAWDKDKARYARASDEFRGMASRLQSEQLNMQRMMEMWNDSNDQRRSPQ